MQTLAITGANGFIGRNLQVRAREAGLSVLPVAHDLPVDVLTTLLKPANLVIHLAGVNRPEDPAEFVTGNVAATNRLAQALTALDRPVPVVYASSTQAANDSPYGRSKRAAEDVLNSYANRSGAPVIIARLPNVFGKWCRPNYNSVVATFCHNIAHDLPITINDPASTLRLLYVDDLVERLVAIAKAGAVPIGPLDLGPIHEISLGDLAAHLEDFRRSRATVTTDRVGTGFLRALHATYLSYLPPESFSYPLNAHTDPRGSFAEVLRTPDCGQISFFTAHPGVTRGGHYHHSKTEKFLVVQGKARFDFRNILTDEIHMLTTSGAAPTVVETVPGWAHAVTNIGQDTLVVLLWANEVFDPDRPDTIRADVLVQ